MTTPFVAGQRVALVMCGSFNPVTNMHLRMFELARDALRNVGLEVVVGFISPVSDGYKKRDLVSAEHRCNIIKAALQPPGWIFLDTFEASLPNWLPTRDALEYFQKKVDDWFEKVEDNDKGIGADAKRAKLDPKSVFSDRQFGERQQTCLAAMYDQNKYRRSPSPPPLRPEGSRHSVDRQPVGGSQYTSKVRVMFLCGADLFESFAVPGLWADEDVLTIAGRFGIVCINRYGSNADRLIYESDLLNENRQNIFVVSDWIVNEISSTKVRRALRRGESVRYLLQDAVVDYIYKHNLYGAIPPMGDINAPHSVAKYFPMLASTTDSPASNNSPSLSDDDEKGQKL